MTDPDVPLTTPGPASRQALIDEEHLRLLGLGYLISAILSGGFSLMGLMYIGIGVVFSRLTFPTAEGQPSPEFFAWFAGIFGLTFFLIFATMAILKFLAYRFLKERRHRVFCMVVAGVTCLGLHGAQPSVCAPSW